MFNKCKKQGMAGHFVDVFILNIFLNNIIIKYVGRSKIMKLLTNDDKLTTALWDWKVSDEMVMRSKLQKKRLFHNIRCYIFT